MNYKQQSALFNLLFIAAKFWIKNADWQTMSIKTLHQCMIDLVDSFRKEHPNTEISESVESWFEMYNYWNSLKMSTE